MNLSDLTDDEINLKVAKEIEPHPFANPAQSALTGLPIFEAWVAESWEREGKTVYSWFPKQSMRRDRALAFLASREKK